MTVLSTQQPGYPRQDSDTFTQVNALWFKAPTDVGYGKSSQDLPQNSLVGRVTGTNLIVLSVQTASDGSQLPIGVTSAPYALANDDSNSGLADSNSEAGADVQGVSYYKDGVFNYDVINKDASWTLALLRAALDRTPLGVDQITTASPGTPSEP